jgi:signal transduction histidine kinase
MCETREPLVWLITQASHPQSSHEFLPRLTRYAVAVIAATLALLLTFLLWPLLDPPVSTLFFAAVMVSAWYGGLGPGLLATLIAVAAIDGFFLHQPGTIALSLHGFVQLVLFVLVATLISSLTAARRHAEEALRKAHDELEQQVQARTAELAEQNVKLLRLQREIDRVEPLAALGRITATMAHELGTPLNSVLGYSQLLAREALSDDARESVRIIEAEVRRMVEIIQSYLSHTHAAPRPAIPIDLNELLRETLRLLAPVSHQYRIHVTTALAAVPLLRADRGSLQRVFLNLFNNAVEAMPDGGTVTITTRVQTLPGGDRGDIIVEIADTGTGIPAELLPTVWDLFVTTKPPGKGMGLGLAICQEIVKGYGGTIELTSQVGKGTSVRIVLPITEASQTAMPVEDKHDGTYSYSG